jgi:DDE superfamily endonuclease
MKSMKSMKSMNAMKIFPFGAPWLVQHGQEFEIFYLPADAPEHNKDEYLNNDLKQTIRNKPPAKTRDDLV